MEAGWVGDGLLGSMGLPEARKIGNGEKTPTELGSFLGIGKYNIHRSWRLSVCWVRVVALHWIRNSVHLIV